MELSDDHEQILRFLIIEGFLKDYKLIPNYGQHELEKAKLLFRNNDWVSQDKGVKYINDKGKAYINELDESIRKVNVKQNRKEYWEQAKPIIGWLVGIITAGIIVSIVVNIRFSLFNFN